VVIVVAVVSSVATTLALGALRPDQSSRVATASDPPASAGSTVPGSSAGVADSVDLTETISSVLPAAVSINTPDASSGSGIVVSDDGWILTNRHVVDCNTTVDVTFEDGRTQPATVTAIDSLSDLALIRTKSTGLTAATLGRSGDLAVGEPVAAIGNSEGFLDNTVTSGVVSALSRQVYLDDEGEYRNLIQTDAAIYGGNSGGPLINLAGEVVGINTATAQTEEFVRAQNLSFAIPSDLAAPIVSQALSGEKLSRPWLGVRHLPVDAGLVDREKLSVKQGALIWPRVGDDGKTRPAVDPSSPAAAAGLRKGDVITAVNGSAVDDRHPLDNVLVAFAAGENVTLTVARGSKTLDVPVELGERKGRPVGC
jgi:S1-C subfamily serine protease